MRGIELLYANGCSMTYGAELGGMQSEAETVQENIHRLRYAWPNQLATLLGISSINDAKGGSSNLRILRTTIEWISHYKNNGNDLSKLFVVIGWSSDARQEFRDFHDDMWWDLLPQWKGQPNPTREKARKAYVKHFFNPKADIIWTCVYIISLQAFLKVNNIPYLFFNGLVENIFGSFVENEGEAQPFYDLIDMSRFYVNDGGMYLYCVKNHKCGPLQHPLEEGHAAWAKILYDIIMERGILNGK